MSQLTLGTGRLVSYRTARGCKSEDGAWTVRRQSAVAKRRGALQALLRKWRLAVIELRDSAL